MNLTKDGESGESPNIYSYNTLNQTTADICIKQIWEVDETFPTYFNYVGIKWDYSSMFLRWFLVKSRHRCAPFIQWTVLTAWCRMVTDTLLTSSLVTADFVEIWSVKSYEMGITNCCYSPWLEPITSRPLSKCYASANSSWRVYLSEVICCKRSRPAGFQQHFPTTTQ